MYSYNLPTSFETPSMSKPRSDFEVFWKLFRKIHNRIPEIIRAAFETAINSRQYNVFRPAGERKRKRTALAVFALFPLLSITPSSNAI